ncbi:MAG: hypothetical protein ACREGB_01835 [Candidatus Saccharimonadales bacterium]
MSIIGGRPAISTCDKILTFPNAGGDDGGNWDEFEGWADKFEFVDGMPEIVGVHRIRTDNRQELYPSRAAAIRSVRKVLLNQIENRTRQRKALADQIAELRTYRANLK